MLSRPGVLQPMGYETLEKRSVNEISQLEA
jgi:hypothetical protein